MGFSVHLYLFYNLYIYYTLYFDAALSSSSREYLSRFYTESRNSNIFKTRFLRISALYCILCMSFQMDRGVYKRAVTIDHRARGGSNEWRLSRQTRSLHGT